MAVLIQEISGTQHGKWVYPNVSGVARAHNFYPQNGQHMPLRAHACEQLPLRAHACEQLLAQLSQ